MSWIMKELYSEGRVWMKSQSLQYCFLLILTLHFWGIQHIFHAKFLLRNSILSSSFPLFWEPSLQL